MTDHLMSQYHHQLPLNRLAVLCGCVRTSYYRRRQRQSPQQRHPGNDSKALISELHRICALETGYGYRRVTCALRQKGRKANHKRILRLMRQENLLWHPRRRFHMPTTDSRHDLKIYPNRAKTMVVKRLNQLWVSDITYLHCGRDRSVYLAAVLDAKSRYCVGWALQPYLDTRLTREALERALKARGPCRVHHSDRGMQYASNEYTTVLHKNKVRISMSRPGNPYDNAVAESLFKTIKTEEIYLQDYNSLHQARQSIKNYIEKRYNQRRLHSSLGYLSPKAYEAAYYSHRRSTLSSSPRVSP